MDQFRHKRIVDHAVKRVNELLSKEDLSLVEILDGCGSVALKLLAEDFDPTRSDELESLNKELKRRLI